ncbi:MAG: NADH-quinone oxidoreductase subunit B family protein [Gemmatimonadaceae bacterium]
MLTNGLLPTFFPQASRKSLWVFHTNVGACNGCDIEILAALTPYFDVERFGIKLIGSPRHADVLLVAGPVTRPMEKPLRALYDAIPDPKIVMAIGACAVGGGPWFDTYNVVGGVDKVIPVDIYVPGCPSRPEAIIHAVAQLLGLVEKRVNPVSDRQASPEELAGASRVPVCVLPVLEEDEVESD